MSYWLIDIFFRFGDGAEMTNSFLFWGLLCLRFTCGVISKLAQVSNGIKLN